MKGMRPLAWGKRAFPFIRPSPAASSREIDWRAALRRGIVKVLLFKLATLAALWALFFSPAHRPSPGPGQVEQHLGVLPAASATLPIPKESSDD